MTTENPSDKLIVALDFPTVEEARAIVQTIDDQCQFYKVGLELLFAGGQDLALELKRQGKRVFVDAKLLDIGATVEKATANIAKMGVDFLTLHVSDQKTLEAAVRGRGNSGLKLLGVSVMTNLDEQDLQQQGITEFSPQELVLKRAQLAKQVGLDGLVSSGHEAHDIRQLVGPDFLIVTPGIRPSGADTQDQTRVMTPGKAIANGANHIVVGRPICQADHPHLAAKAIQEEISNAV